MTRRILARLLSSIRAGAHRAGAAAQAAPGPRRRRGAALIAAAWLAVAGGTAAAQDIGVVAIAEHPALIAARDGIADALAAAGAPAPVWAGGGGDPAAVTALVEAWSDQGAELIVALAAPTAEAALAATGDRPLILAAAVAPGFAVAQGAALAGAVTDGTPLTGLADAIAALHPDGRLGILAPTAQAAWAEAVATAAEAAGMAVTVRPVASLPEVLVAVSQLARSSDALALPGGDLATQAIDAVVAIGDGAATPVYTDDVGLLANGAAGSVTVDYYDLGRIAGQQALDLLAGGAGGTVPAPGSVILLNGATIDRLGVIVPPALAGRVERVAP